MQAACVKNGKIPLKIERGILQKMKNKIVQNIPSFCLDSGLDALGNHAGEI